ncbi:MAG: hypothetical protein L6Q66_05820 [Bacteroidia bacterium]|nr:hypothetical protein [Bacteroidia bacterium]
MNRNKYEWKKLIYYWVKIKGRSGLSIPFIIGTRTLTDKGFIVDSNCVIELLNEIKDSNDDEVVTLQHCENIREYVLGLNDPNMPKDGLLVPNEKTGKTRIIATLNTAFLGKTFEDIIKSLTSRYKDCLTNKTFSRIDYQWSAFSDSDLAMIENALKK